MNDIDLKQELEEELRREARHEELMRSDWEYAVKSMYIEDDMTLKEFKEAIKTLENYGWNFTDQDILELIAF